MFELLFLDAERARVEMQRPCWVCDQPIPAHDLPHHQPDEPPWWNWAGTATIPPIDWNKIGGMLASATG